LSAISLDSIRVKAGLSISSTIREYSRGLDAAAAGGAAAIGVGVTAERIQGYAPFRADPRLHALLRATAEAHGVQFVEEPFSASSSDMGDASRLKPSVIVGLPGTNGRLHEASSRSPTSRRHTCFRRR
jgi:metal-dependent amidase/aminoacylase/carboxypeptidase family protein